MGLARDLNLSDEQKAQAQKIMAAVEESTKGLHEQLRALHQNAPGPLSGAAFDEAAVRKAAQERASLQVELEVAHARAHSQLYALLTAEQKAKLAERHQQMEGRRQEGGPRRGGDRPEFD
jgi:Spy/CpxP family protein refolding chaperone